jgi:hypothetical protein
MRLASRGTIWLEYADAGRKRKFPAEHLCRCFIG